MFHPSSQHFDPPWLNLVNGHIHPDGKWSNEIHKLSFMSHCLSMGPQIISEYFQMFRHPLFSNMLATLAMGLERSCLGVFAFLRVFLVCLQDTVVLIFIKEMKPCSQWAGAFDFQGQFFPENWRDVGYVGWWWKHKPKLSVYCKIYLGSFWGDPTNIIYNTWLHV